MCRTRLLVYPARRRAPSSVMYRPGPSQAGQASSNSRTVAILLARLSTQRTIKEFAEIVFLPIRCPLDRPVSRESLRFTAAQGVWSGSASTLPYPSDGTGNIRKLSSPKYLPYHNLLAQFITCSAADGSNSLHQETEPRLTQSIALCTAFHISRSCAPHELPVHVSRVRLTGVRLRGGRMLSARRALQSCAQTPECRSAGAADPRCHCTPR